MKKRASMHEKIREVLATFSAPRPTSDEARRRRLLDFVLVAMVMGAALGLLFVLAALVGWYATSPADLRNALIGVGLALACTAVIFVLNRWLSTDLAALFLVVLLLAIIVVSDEPAQVANGRTLLFFALPIVIAAVLVRPWVGFIVAAVSSLVLIGLSFDPAAGPPNVYAMVAFFILAGLVGFATATQEWMLRELVAANGVQAIATAERQQVEAQRDATLIELAQERTLLRTLIDNLPDTIYAKDAQARFVLNNAAQLHTLGAASLEASLGKSDFDFYPPELAARFFADDQQVIASGQPLLAREEPALDQTTGASLQRLTTKIPLCDAEGRVIGLVGIGRDITELKAAQAAERDQRLLAEALRDAAAAVASTLSFDEVLDRILAELDRVVSHDAARIMLIEEGVARGVRGRGYDERSPAAPITALRLPVAETVNLRTMVETGRPFVVSDTTIYPGWIVHSQQPWVRSNAGAPLCVRGQVIGFLSVDSTTPGFFTPAHAERLQAFADQAAVALENARLHEDAQRRNRELTLLNQVAELASRPTAPAALLQQILEALMPALGFEAGWITLPGATLDDPPTVAAHCGVTPQFVAAEAAGPLATCPTCTYVLAHGKIAGPMLVAQCPRLDPAVITEEGLLDHIGVPLRAGERVLGILNVGFRQPAAYGEHQRALLTAVGRQVGLALDNAHLYQTLQEHAVTLEQTVAQRTGELAQANERLTELDRLKREFIAQASHELRTPLTNIKTSVYLLERGKPEKRGRYMATLNREADVLHRLVEDLLALLSLDLGHLRPVKQPVAIAALIERLAAEQAGLLAGRELTLRVTCAPDLPEVQADPKLLTQALVNLVANAAERAPYGSEIGVACGWQPAEGGWVTIAVCEPVVVIASMAGAGLRRAISEEIARHHGGRLTDDGHGVTLWLPAGGDGVTR